MSSLILTQKRQPFSLRNRFGFTETDDMPNELNPAGNTALGNLKIVPETESPAGTANLVHIYNDQAAVINIRNFVTPIQWHPLENDFSRTIKRSIDIIVSLIVIVGVLTWLIPLMAVLIKLDSKGPVFFLQKRNKRGGELFNCIKFRSMRNNADADILPAGRNDSRITNVGKWLRNYYLDELPQFFNVLWGDMSVIGPRPHMVSENLKYDGLIRNYSARHKVKPGITGLAQAMGYVGKTDNAQKMKTRVDMDIFYIRHWSIRLDMIILFRTLCKSIGL